jgi:hypothetical protein
MNGEWIDVTCPNDDKPRMRWQPSVPVPPPCRVSYVGFLRSFYGPEDEFYRWMAEPLWRRIFRRTAADRANPPFWRYITDGM